MDHGYGRPWVKIDEHVTPILAGIVGASRPARPLRDEAWLTVPPPLAGAKPSEVACMGSLTGNLHTLFTSFYRPTPQRHKILYEGKAFPSDAVRASPPPFLARAHS